MAFAKTLILPSLVAVVLVTLVGRRIIFPKSPSYEPWHMNEAWDRLLKVYDETADEVYKKCESKLVNTSFGMTQTYACGHRFNSPPVMFFHGAASDSSLFGEWLLPAVVKQNMFAVAVDYICDTGRSIPKDGKVENCPSNEKEIVQWVEEIAAALFLKTPVSMVGYSYGSYISFSTALHKPELVDKLVLLAPGLLFRSLSKSFFFRAMVSNMMMATNSTQDWLWKSLTTNSSFSLQTLPPRNVEHFLAMRDVQATVLKVMCNGCYSDKTLKEVMESHDTFVGIGEKDSTVSSSWSPQTTSTTWVAERALDDGATKVVVYPGAGHLMCWEHPTDELIVQDVLEFLRRKSSVHHPAEPKKPMAEPEVVEKEADPVVVVEEPKKKKVEEPKKVVEEPKKIVEEPKKIVEEPKKPVEEPKKPVEETKKKVEESKKIVEEPKKPVEEAKTPPDDEEAKAHHAFDEKVEGILEAVFE
jgi:pimeloyl-ACP methyl ester carboxylesterase